MSADEAPPRRLFLLDGHSLSYRAYFALPPTLATSSGQVTNAAFGFTSMLIKLLGEEHPDLIAVAFDKGKPTVRLEQYPEYKAGRRETPDDFRQQLPLIREVVETLRIPIVEVEGYEADDAIGTLAVRAQQAGHRRRDRHGRPRLLPAGPARHHGDVQPARGSPTSSATTRPR